MLGFCFVFSLFVCLFVFFCLFVCFLLVRLFAFVLFCHECVDKCTFGYTKERKERRKNKKGGGKTPIVNYFQSMASVSD